MSVKENLELIDSMIASYNSRDWRRLADTYAESALFYEPSVEPYRGRNAIMKSYRDLHATFPDEQIRKVRSFGEGEWICVEMLASGTHRGQLAGPDGRTILPTNRNYEIEIAAAVRFEDGKIAEYREYFDKLGLLTQLGID